MSQSEADRDSALSLPPWQGDHALASGVDAKTLFGILGHTNASFTLDTYTHVTNGMQQSAADKVGGFMNEVTGATPAPEPPDPEPTQESRCKVIPF